MGRVGRTWCAAHRRAPGCALLHACCVGILKYPPSGRTDSLSASAHVYSAVLMSPTSPEQLNCVSATCRACNRIRATRHYHVACGAAEAKQQRTPERRTTTAWVADLDCHPGLACACTTITAAERCSQQVWMRRVASLCCILCRYSYVLSALNVRGWPGFGDRQRGIGDGSRARRVWRHPLRSSRGRAQLALFLQTGYFPTTLTHLHSFFFLRFDTVSMQFGGAGSVVECVVGD